VNQPAFQTSRRPGWWGCAGGLVAGFLVAVLLGVGVLLIAMAKTVPARAEHEKQVRQYFTATLQEKPTENAAEDLVKSLLLFGNSLAQGAEVSYIDVLGFEYRERLFYSEVWNPREVEGKQRVSFGIFGKVYMGKPDQSKVKVGRGDVHL
jgi:hypothetical protein